MSNTVPFKSIFTDLITSSFVDRFKPFADKMEEEGLPPIVINMFKYFYFLMLMGATGRISEKEIDSIGDNEFKHYRDLAQYVKAGQAGLDKTVVIKLNGGLGTSMGLSQAKSLIEVKNGYSFLDIILKQTESLRKKYSIDLPLVFMNSFNTEEQTKRALGEFTNPKGIPLTFLQHKFPKILQKDYLPAEADDKEMEWNPAGHGDVYTSLITSGLLKELLDNGYRYAFISNVDNLGAVLDERILGYMVKKRLPFIMEVAKRTSSDKKGGHLARLQNGRLVLREVAQCPEEDLNAFQNVSRHKFFNTNSIWINLEVLEKVFIHNQMMPLDMILNPKHLDPKDDSTPQVFQIETAMGSAVSAFYDASAICVPRTRFSPVKTCNDLLTVQSDCYTLTEDSRVTVNQMEGDEVLLPEVSLDSRYFKKLEQFESRFPFGPPSMAHCSSLKVEGDVVFGPGIVLKGDVFIINRTSRRLVVSQQLLEWTGYSILLSEENSTPSKKKKQGKSNKSSRQEAAA